MMLYDDVVTDGIRITNDGYLVAEARVARTGIQLYSAGELGLDGEPGRPVRVYRPPEEVFAADAMASYAHRPITSDHPSELIDAANWQEFAKGQTGDEVLRDGEFVRVPIMLMDKAAIEDHANGKRQLSMGYTMDLDTTAGTTPEGEQYDAVQTNLRMNHLALVSRARGGSDLKLGDNHMENSTTMSDLKLTTVTVDGLSVETTDAGAQAISKLQTELADARKTVETEGTAHATELAAKDTELAGKDAEIDTLKATQLSDADLDKKVNDRADLIATAHRVADKDYSGLSDTDIRKTAVAAALGQDTVDGKSDDYISARFDILSEDATQDPVRRVVRGKLQVVGDDVTEAHTAMVDNMQDAWKGSNRGGAE
jgi:hypothetical protein